MQTFVTGATGLLGNNLVRALVAEGHSVRALVRSRAKAADVLGDLPRVELVEGDMGDVAAFADALEGCDTLFHTAAYFREYYGRGDHWPQLERINVEGTLALVEAAHARGVRRAVDTSSAGIIGKRPDGTPGDESTPPAPVAASNLYFRSKVLAEERVRAFAERTGFHVSFLLPGWMFGPWDAAPTAAGRLLTDLLDGKIPAVLPGGSCLVDARDVAAGAMRIAERGRPTERYLVAGPFHTLGELVGSFARVTGRPAPRLELPYAAALGLAWASELGARLRGTDTVLTVEGVRTMAARLAATSAKAERELGVTFRPLDDTVRDSVAWIETHRAAGAPAAALRTTAA